MFGIEYNVDSKKWIFQTTKIIKTLFCKYCGLKSFLQIVPKENTLTGMMRRYKQVLETHLALS